MASKILLADGNITAQNLGKKILIQAGYDVVTVSNGVAAVKKIAELHPEVALLDVYMPGYSGVEVCEKAKAAPETGQTAILLTVGKTEPFRAEEAIKAKADGVITKPFQARDLTIVLARLMQRVDATQPCGVVDGIIEPPCDPLKNASAELQAAVYSRPVPKEPPEKSSSDSAATGDRHASPPSRAEGGEVCDVCGCVNRDGADVCRQCDVPLPSSVLLHRGKASGLA